MEDPYEGHGNDIRLDLAYFDHEDVWWWRLTKGGSACGPQHRHTGPDEAVACHRDWLDGRKEAVA